jgi:hypothetical protein
MQQEGISGQTGKGAGCGTTMGCCCWWCCCDVVVGFVMIWRRCDNGGGRRLARMGCYM